MSLTRSPFAHDVRIIWGYLQDIAVALAFLAAVFLLVDIAVQVLFFIGRLAVSA